MLVPPDPLRGEGRWDQFITAHSQTLWAYDFSVKAWTARWLIGCYLLLFIHIGSRNALVSPATRGPTGRWVDQQARNFCIDVQVTGKPAKYLIRERDGKIQGNFDDIIKSEGIKLVKLPIRSPDLNAFAELAIQSIKSECLPLLMIFGARQP